MGIIRLALVGLIIGIFFDSAILFARPVERDVSPYKNEGCASDKVFRGLQAQEIDGLVAYFQGLGLNAVNPHFGEGQSFLEMDEVFVSENLDSIVMLKFCLEPTDKADHNTIFRVGNDLLYHSQTRSGVAFALYFVGVDESRVESWTKGLSEHLQNTGSSSGAYLWNMMMSSVYAQSHQRAHRRSSSASRGVRAGENRSTPISESETSETQEREIPREIPRAIPVNSRDKQGMAAVLSGAGQCGTGLAKGVYKGSVGVLEHGVRLAFRFVKSAGFAMSKPVEAWNKMSKELKQLVEVVRNFKLSKALSDGRRGFNSMKLDDQIKFICGIVGQLGIGATLAIFAAPSIPLVLQGIWAAIDGHRNLEELANGAGIPKPDSTNP